MLVERHKLEAYGFIVTVDVLSESSPDGKYLTTDVHRDVEQCATGILFKARDVLEDSTLEALAYVALESTREAETWRR